MSAIVTWTLCEHRYEWTVEEGKRRKYYSFGLLDADEKLWQVVAAQKGHYDDDVKLELTSHKKDVKENGTLVDKLEFEFRESGRLDPDPEPLWVLGDFRTDKLAADIRVKVFDGIGENDIWQDQDPDLPAHLPAKPL
jgi:hypothetical protein